MKKLLSLALFVGFACGISANAPARDRTSPSTSTIGATDEDGQTERVRTQTTVVSGNTNIVGGDFDGGADDDFGDVGPTSDGDPQGNPFTAEDWEFELFDNPNQDGMQYVVVDATDFADIVHIEWTAEGMIRVFGDSTVNGTIVAQFDQVFDPLLISRVSNQPATNFSANRR